MTPTIVEWAGKPSRYAGFLIYLAWLRRQRLPATSPSSCVHRVYLRWGGEVQPPASPCACMSAGMLLRSMCRWYCSNNAAARAGSGWPPPAKSCAASSK